MHPLDTDDAATHPEPVSGSNDRVSGSDPGPGSGIERTGDHHDGPGRRTPVLAPEPLAEATARGSGATDAHRHARPLGQRVPLWTGKAVPALCSDEKGGATIDHHLSVAPIDQAQTLQSRASSRDEITIAFVMGSWLHEKFTQSQSSRTKDTYRGVLQAFRSFLLAEGLDLTMLPPADGTLADVEERLATRAQAFATMSLSGRSDPISPATRNKRLAILSSFYVFASRRHRRLFPFSNPISLVERSKVQPYGKAKPLDQHAVNQGLATPDTTTMQGARDKALLAILLQTGRRVSEVTDLTWENVEISGASGLVTLHFERTKGGDVMKDTLPRPVSQLLLQWLQLWYKQTLATLAPDTPLWVNVAPYHHDYGKPLKYQGVAGIVKHYLGTSKVHRTRHTFSRNMLKMGATVKDVQQRLGHKNIATTQIYTEQMTNDENPFADQLTALLGLHAFEQQ